MKLRWGSLMILQCALASMLLAATLAAEGVIAGSIMSSNGPVAGATVRARDLSTGSVHESTVLRDGTFVLSLPAAIYDVFVRKAQYSTVTRRGISIVNSQSVRLDLMMNPNGNVDVPGESSFQLLSERASRVSGEIPKTSDDKPDLSGVWLPSLDLDADDPPYLAWAGALQKERAAAMGKDDPRGLCLPPGTVRTNLNDLTKFVQTKLLLVILMEGSPPGFRQVFLDGRGHSADLEPSWMGESIGRWDGETLVIDTIGFHDRGWIDASGKPQTTKLHVIERMRRPDLGTLDIEITVDDPGAYERPWKLRRELKLAPDEELREYVCNENERQEHLVGK